MSEPKTKPDRWVGTEPVIDNRADCDLQIGLYWVVIEGDYEPGEAGSMLYDYPTYMTTFTIREFDEETGVPIGSGEYDEEWQQVQYVWSAPIFKPEMPSE